MWIRCQRLCSDFRKRKKVDNKSGNSIQRAFSGSGLDVMEGMVFMDKNYLYQVDIREWIEDGLDAEIMVPVSGNRVDKKYDVYIMTISNWGGRE